MKANVFFEDIRSKLRSIYDTEEANSITYLLLEHLFELSRNELIINERIFHSSDIDKVQPYIQRLVNHEPIQYVLEEAHFYGSTFYVDSNVLIPRTETEELVHLIIKTHKKHNRHLNILDVGTGSGCIPITLFHHLQNVTIYAVDISPKAIEIAQKNAKKLKANIEFKCIDILKNNLSELPNFDIIISNPPYVQELEKKDIKPHVLHFEPELALFVPNRTPLLFYERILALSSEKLNPQGFIYFEINEQFGEEMQVIFKKYKFQEITIHKDIHGKDRIVSGNRP